MKAAKTRLFLRLLVTKKIAPAVTRRKDIGRPISFQREQRELKAPESRSDEETEAVSAKRVRRNGNQHFLALAHFQVSLNSLI